MSSGPEPLAPRPPSVIPLGEGYVDLDESVVHRGGQRLGLTPIEQRLLAYLAAQPGRLVGRDELLVDVWGYRPGIRSRTIDNTVRRLREKVEPDPACPTHLEVVYGRGLRWNPTSPTEDLPDPSPPEASSGLYGRAAELHRIFHPGAPWVGVTGAPGAGTSRLLAEVARLATHRGRVVQVDLRGATDDDELLTRLGLALDAPPEPRALGAALGGRPTWLVADGAEGVADALRERVAEWSAPQLRVVIGARGATARADEPWITLGPLGDDDAVAMFLAAARRWAPRRAFEDSPELRAVLAAVDRLPLAIELLAARAAVLRPAQMLDRIDRKLDWLDGGQLRKVIDQSLDAIPEAERVTARELAVFAGPQPLTDLAAVVSDPDVLDRVTTLADHGLVSVGPRGWGLYELVRDRIRERWPDRDATLRHARWYGRDAGALLDGSLGARLTRSMGELRAAWDRGLPPELAGPIGVSLLVVAANHAPRAAALKIADQVLACDLTPALRANAHAMAADIHLFLGSTDPAMALVRDGRPFATDVNRKLQLRLIGVRACRIGGRMDEAVAELAELEALAGRAAPHVAAWFHRLAGEVDWFRGEAASAEAHYRRGLPLADAAGRSALLSLLATVLRTRGDYDEARQLYEEAMAPSCTARNEAVHRFHLAVLERCVGHLDRASAQLDRVEALHRHLGNDWGMMLVQTERALLAEQQGAFDEAEQGLLSVLNGAPLHPSQTWTWAALARVRLRAGRTAAARHPVDRALELARRGGFGSVTAPITDLGAMLEAASGAIDAARASLAATEPRIAPFGPAPLAVHEAIAAAIEGRWGDPARAAAHLARAEQLAGPRREPQSEISRWIAFAASSA